nr:acyltransferase [uncultured Ralstonia sp.]
MRTSIKSLEGVRGVAALLVVLHHMFYAPTHPLFVNAYLAVDLFFVLSGFVISSAYGARLSNLPSLQTFVIRRIGRLWPTHIATTLLALAVVRQVPPLGEVAALITMSQGLNLFSDAIGNVVSWSVSDEMYVYLVFGAACFLMRGTARMLAFAVLAVCAYALAVWIEIERGCLQSGGCLNGLIFQFGWTRCLAGFFIGALIDAFRDRAVAMLGSSPVQLTAISASFLLLMFADNLPGSALTAPLVFGVLIGSLAGDRGPVARMLQTAPAQYLGRVSYPLYLGHGVMFIPLAGYAAGAGLTERLTAYALFLFWTFGIAHLLHKYVEVPFRNRFNAWSRPTSRSSSTYAQIKERQ